MYNNPYQEEPIGISPTDPLPPMEELQLRPVPQQTPYIPPANESAVAPGEEAESVDASQEEARTIKFAIGKLNDFLQWFLLVLEVMLIIRFIFKLIGADPNNLFAGFLYALTEIIILPFSNIVPTPSFGRNQFFEWSTLIAMAIYWLIFWAVRRFLHILISSPEESVE